MDVVRIRNATIVVEAYMGQVVLITGGTSGIGQMTAELFLQQNYQVAIMGRDSDKGQQVVHGFLQNYPQARIEYIQGDVARTADCAKAVEQVVGWGGSLDILINSAGRYFEKALEDVSEDDFDAMLGINLKGTVFMTKYAVIQMKKQGAGSIVNISSDAGLHGNMLCSTYCASKGGVNMFTKAMALELGPYGIRINAVCPGDVLTPLTEAQLEQYPDRQAALQEMASVYPLGRIAKVNEVTEVVCFLAGPKASFVNGALWSVDGGLT